MKRNHAASLALLFLAPIAAAQRSAPPQGSSGGFIHYDWLDEGVVALDAQPLRGGRIAVEPGNPLHGPVEDLLFSSAPSNVVTLIDNGPSANRVDLVLVGDGYTAGQLGAYASHASNVVATFFAEHPLATYATFFNVHRVDVISTEAGVDNDPSQGVSKNTALDMGFWCSGIERLLCVNVSKANAQAANAPAVDQILALANSTKYGGAGYNDLGTLAANNGAAIEIALHEFGHSMPGLADEYDYGGSSTYTGPEPGEKNVSKLTAGPMLSQMAKWWRWLDLPHVDAFEGAKYSQLGIYRPTNNSKMRSLGRPFEEINVEQFVFSFYEVVDPIDGASPAGTHSALEILRVLPVRPVGHALDVQWLVDGAPVAGATSEAFLLDALAKPPGQYDVEVRVVDNTSMVRDETKRAQLMSSSRSWTVRVRNLDALESEVSLSAGGAQAMRLNAGSAQAGRVYWLFGTTAGSSPGLPIGSFVLPLNDDGPGGYFTFTGAHPNQAPLAGSLGVLDADGRGNASFNVPSGASPSLVGITLHHAYLVFDTSAAVTFASDALAVTLAL